MMDETSIIASLARRGARMKDTEKEPVDVERALFAQLAECRRECEQHKAAALSAADMYNRACDQHKREMDAVREQVASSNSTLAQWQAKCEALEKRPPEVRYQTNAADDSLRTENAALQARCARAEALSEEKDRTIGRLDAQITQMRSVPEPEEPEAEEHEDQPSYDIDVVRGGDNRIRTLRVRVAE